MIAIARPMPKSRPPRGDWSAKGIATRTMTRFTSGNESFEYSSTRDRKSTRLNSSHGYISYAVFCLKKKNTTLRNFGVKVDVIGKETLEARIMELIESHTALAA